MANLAIAFSLDPLLKLEKAVLHQRSGKLLIDVEGELNITIDHSCFFREPALAILELGVHLKEWRVEDSDAIANFYHFTMEHDEKEGPILAFIRESENKWHLFSIWQEFKHEETITTDILLKAVDRYLTELEETLIKRFNIRYSDFIKF
ncbi:DUF7878 domain-containing protein [Planococcus sp. CAU13]|uniref:DUF7878 domain-containing protein n=1 Tax=Planococcus sp. CAU13 TaxID=1541197 RepID=UPI00052FFB08|nr:hypothetical protein [Planococcus sp. CAU13]